MPARSNMAGGLEVTPGTVAPGGEVTIQGPAGATVSVRFGSEPGQETQVPLDANGRATYRVPNRTGVLWFVIWGTPPISADVTVVQSSR